MKKYILLTPTLVILSLATSGIFAAILSGLLCVLVLKIVDTYKVIVDPFPTLLYVGKKGVGKTLNATEIARKTKRKHIYSNIDGLGTYVSSTEYCELNPFTGKPAFPFEYDSLVIIDEAGLVHDNRDFKKFQKSTNAFIKYARKNGLQIVYLSQTVDIDKKIRSVLDGIYILERFGPFLVERKYKHKITTAKDPATGGEKLVDTEHKVGLPKIRYLGRMIAYNARYDTTETDKELKELVK